MGGSEQNVRLIAIPVAPANDAVLEAERAGQDEAVLIEAVVDCPGPGEGERWDGVGDE